MADLVRRAARIDEWGVVELLVRFPGLAVQPQVGAEVVVAGVLACRVTRRRGLDLDVSYQVEIRIPPDFPRTAPKVWETGGKIQQHWHRQPTGELCLATPAEQRLLLRRHPTLEGFLESVVIPYLYSHAFWRATIGGMPFGERPHGLEGILQHLAGLFRLPRTSDLFTALYLAGLKRREANKKPCPCRSGLRLGRCHHRQVNAARAALGRAWCRGHLREWASNQARTSTANVHASRRRPSVARR